MTIDDISDFFQPWENPYLTSHVTEHLKFKRSGTNTLSNVIFSLLMVLNCTEPDTNNQLRLAAVYRLRL